MRMYFLSSIYEQPKHTSETSQKSHLWICQKNHGKVCKDFSHHPRPISTAMDFYPFRNSRQSPRRFESRPSIASTSFAFPHLGQNEQKSSLDGMWALFFSGRNNVLKGKRWEYLIGKIPFWNHFLCLTWQMNANDLDNPETLIALWT